MSLLVQQGFVVMCVCPSVCSSEGSEGHLYQYGETGLPAVLRLQLLSPLIISLIDRESAKGIDNTETQLQYTGTDSPDNFSFLFSLQLESLSGLW